MITHQIELRQLFGSDSYRVYVCQACKFEDLGKLEFDEEVKKRFKMVYVPNWFSVDLKTGVRIFLLFCYLV